MMPFHKGRLIGLVLILLVVIWVSTWKADEPSKIQSNAEQGGANVPTSPNLPSTTVAEKVGNTVPIVKTIRLIPLPVSAGQAIRAEVVTEDKDGDFVQLRYEWQVNGKPIRANDIDTLSGDQVHSADQILVFVTPSDPSSKGEASVSPLVTVLNRPPEIVSLPPNKDNKGKYTYQIVAKDPDSDPLNYILISGPTGMEVNPTTGLVLWDVAPLSGKQSDVALEVNDKKGGKVVQQFTLQTFAR